MSNAKPRNGHNVFSGFSGSATSMLLGTIASLALLVGGIGIMNNMLVWVTDRTREVGVRLAIGATEGDTQFQFLAEAVAISILGRFLGVIAGIGASSLFQSTLRWEINLTPQLLVCPDCSPLLLEFSLDTIRREKPPSRSTPI